MNTKEISNAELTNIWGHTKNILRKQFPMVDLSIIEDAVQTACMKWWEHRSKINTPQAFLLISGKNYILDVLKSSSYNIISGSGWLENIFSNHRGRKNPTGVQNLSESIQQDTTISSENISALMEIIDKKLTEKQRQFVKWYWFKEPNEEFSQKHRTSMYNRASIMKKKLRKLLYQELQWELPQEI